MARGRNPGECYRGGEVCPHCRIAETNRRQVTDVHGVVHGVVQPLSVMMAAARGRNPRPRAKQGILGFYVGPPGVNPSPICVDCWRKGDRPDLAIHAYDRTRASCSRCGKTIWPTAPRKPAAAPVLDDGWAGRHIYGTTPAGCWKGRIGCARCRQKLDEHDERGRGTNPRGRMTLAAAQAEARRRWGPHANARFMDNAFRVGGRADLEDYRGLASGSWEAAFADADRREKPARTCDMCSAPREPGMLFCAAHLKDEYARWFREEGRTGNPSRPRTIEKHGRPVLTFHGKARELIPYAYATKAEAETRDLRRLQRAYAVNLAPFRGRDGRWYLEVTGKVSVPRRSPVAARPARTRTEDCVACYGAGCDNCQPGVDHTSCQNCDDPIEDPERAVLCRKCILELGTEAACPSCGEVFTPSQTPNCAGCGKAFPGSRTGNPERPGLPDGLSMAKLYRISIPSGDTGGLHGRKVFLTGLVRDDPRTGGLRVQVTDGQGSSAAGTVDHWWVYPHALVLDERWGKHFRDWPRGTNPAPSVRCRLCDSTGDYPLVCSQCRGAMCAHHRYRHRDTGADWCSRCATKARTGRRANPSLLVLGNPGLDSWAGEPARQVFHYVDPALLPAIRAGARRAQGRVTTKKSQPGHPALDVTITFHGASWANSQDLRAAFREGLAPLRIEPYGLPGGETLLRSGARAPNPSAPPAVKRAWEKFHFTDYEKSRVVEVESIPGVPEDLVALGQWIDLGIEGDGTWSRWGQVTPKVMDEEYGRKNRPSPWLCYDPKDDALWIVATEPLRDAGKVDGAKVSRIAYRTHSGSAKDHAVYEHRFHKPLPTLEVVRHRGHALAVMLQGGRYTVTDWIRK